MVALMMMCGGDGVADLVGRRFRSPRLPWSSEKSVAGSLSVFVGGFGLSLAILAVYVPLGVFPAPLVSYLLPLGLIALVSMLVESLPHKDVDNVTMTITAALLGWWLLAL
jgi:phytol kinase